MTRDAAIGNEMDEAGVDGSAADRPPDDDARADKTPRTDRGRRTRHAILDAAADEFGELGFHAASISAITRRAGVAAGTFYTYFDSKDAVFRALVQDLSDRVRDVVAPAVRSSGGGIDAERAGLLTFLEFARAHKELYRIVDEAEFVDPASHRAHYLATANRIRARLEKAGAAGQVRRGLGEIEAWAIMGMNVFLGLRYAVWGDDLPLATVADAAMSILGSGIGDPDRRNAP